MLAPLLTACVAGFCVAAARVTAMARAEAALSNAIAADAAGSSVGGALHGRARLVRLDATTVEIAIDAPFGAVVARGHRIG